MTVCEFCKSKYDDDDLEFCPSCGAKLKKVYDPLSQVTINQPKSMDTGKKSRIIVSIVLGLVVVLAIWGVISALSPSDKSQPEEKTVMSNYSAVLTETDEPDETSLFEYELMPKIAEHIWPDAELTTDQLSQITYFSFYLTDDVLEVGYGLDDPFGEGFEAEHFSISIANDQNAVIEIKQFEGLQRLETNITFTPSNIEALHNLKYLACPYNASDLSQLESLSSLESLIISSYSLTALQGIEHLTALRELSLERVSVTDLSLLSQCKALTSLSINRCSEIQNFDIIGDLGGLTSLSIANSDGLDFNFVGKLKMLKSLTISSTKTKTLAFVGELPNLEYLCLSRNSDAKVMPSFERLTDSLKELVFDASGLDDVDFLAVLINLEKLEIRNPPAGTPLSGMVKLQELTISPGWSVDTLAPLGNLTALKKLTFVQNTGFTPWDNGVFSFLSHLDGLEELSFAGCGLYFNADPVYTLTNLKVLDFSGNAVCGDFSNIKNLTNLESLNLAKTRLASSFWVESDGFVTSIGITGEQTMDSQASNLAALTNLRELDVSGTELQDIAFLRNLTNLEYFYASDNYITDVFVLSELPMLQVADLSANAVTNWETLDSMKDTQIIGRP